MESLSIGAVEKILTDTGRPVTRHWLQQLKKRMKAWGTAYPVIDGKGRHGDQFPLTTICQIALHYDISRQIEAHQEAWSKIAFNEVTAKMFSESLSDAMLAKGYNAKVNALSLLNKAKSIALPSYKFMGLAVLFDADWHFDFKYIAGKEKLDDLQERIQWDSRVTVIFNLSLIAWLVVEAAKGES